MKSKDLSLSWNFHSFDVVNISDVRSQFDTNLALIAICLSSFSIQIDLMVLEKKIILEVI